MRPDTLKRQNTCSFPPHIACLPYYTTPACLQSVFKVIVRLSRSSGVIIGPLTAKQHGWRRAIARVAGSAVELTRAWVAVVATVRRGRGCVSQRVRAAPWHAVWGGSMEDAVVVIARCCFAAASRRLDSPVRWRWVPSLQSPPPSTWPALHQAPAQAAVPAEVQGALLPDCSTPSRRPDLSSRTTPSTTTSRLPVSIRLLLPPPLKPTFHSAPPLQTRRRPPSTPLWYNNRFACFTARPVESYSGAPGKHFREALNEMVFGEPLARKFWILFLMMTHSGVA